MHQPVASSPIRVRVDKTDLYEYLNQDIKEKLVRKRASVRSALMPRTDFIDKAGSM